MKLGKKIRSLEIELRELRSKIRETETLVRPPKTKQEKLKFRRANQRLKLQHQCLRRLEYLPPFPVKKETIAARVVGRG